MGQFEDCTFGGAIVYALNHNLDTPLASVPPPDSGLVLFPEPALALEVVAKLLHAICYPFALADERRHPVSIVEHGYQPKQRDDGRQFVEDEKGSNVSDGGITKGSRVALQEARHFGILVRLRDPTSCGQ